MVLIFSAWVLWNVSKEIKKIKYQNKFFRSGRWNPSCLETRQERPSYSVTVAQLHAQRTSFWEEWKRTKEVKAADVKEVLSPTSFITTFYQATCTQKQESATATPLAPAWKPSQNWRTFEQGFQTRRYTVLYIWFSVWQIKEPVFFSISSAEKKKVTWMGKINLQKQLHIMIRVTDFELHIKN